MNGGWIGLAKILVICGFTTAVHAQAPAPDTSAPLQYLEAAVTADLDHATNPSDAAHSSNPENTEIPLVEEPTDRPVSEPSAEAWLSSLSGNSIRLMLMLGLLSLAPAAFLMTTSYVRIVVVLSLLKQALGNQQALPAQATTALALFMTALVMTPVWQQVYTDAIQPYRESEGEMSALEAWQTGVQPVRKFMSRQIDKADNSEDVWLFFRYLPEEQQSTPPQTYDDVPLQVLLPAFLLSELKTAFLIGFQIYLPFLVLDFVIASVTASMGLTMLPPATISFPFKLMLFVLVDGWRLVAATLLESFGNLL